MSEQADDKSLRVRKNINNLSKDEMDLLIKAWAGIQANKPEPDKPFNLGIQANKPDLDDPHNLYPKDFFTIAGFHGMPFRGAGYNDPSWWGGYCNHGNVLFPTWHRAYLLCLENALRSVEGCENVSMPYWNELEAENSPNPIPKIFLEKEYTYSDGKTIKNPLHSYIFPRTVLDTLSKFPDADYTKRKDYETVRYPFSGLVGKDDGAKTGAHNRLMNLLNSEKEGMTDRLLQDNVRTWISADVENSDGKWRGGHMALAYVDCLFADNYTIFSNTTSAQKWNEERFIDIKHDDGSPDLSVFSLEKPHNGIHLAIGGYDIPGSGNSSFVPDANGDMGENDTASFDPIFFFHHCWIDLVFWAWQLKNNKTEPGKLEIIKHYPGTNSVDSQGPTPGIPGGTWLTMDTHLAPFLDSNGKEITSHDMTVITDLGYEYDEFAEVMSKMERREPKATPHVRVSGVNRADARGSFLMSVWTGDNADGTRELVGLEPVLSRWHVAGCANCGTHLNVSTTIPMRGFSTSSATTTQFEVLIHTRDNRFGTSTLGGKTPNLRVGLLSI